MRVVSRVQGPEVAGRRVRMVLLAAPVRRAGVSLLAAAVIGGSLSGCALHGTGQVYEQNQNIQKQLNHIERQLTDLQSRVH